MNKRCILPSILAVTAVTALSMIGMTFSDVKQPEQPTQPAAVTDSQMGLEVVYADQYSRRNGIVHSEAGI